MADSIIVDSGLKLAINRIYKSTPDYTATSRFKVGTGTTDPVAGDTDLETPVNIDADNWKNFESGYPTLDETNMEATVRCKLGSTEANSNNISEFGVFNTDGTPLMQSRTTFTAISKSNTDEVLFIAVDKLERG